MKQIYKVLLMLCATFLSMGVTGCSDEIDMPEGPQPDCINLTVSVPLASATRAAADELNEFKVKSLHLYFYASDGYDEATSSYLFDYEVTGEFEFSRELRINLPEDALKNGGLFGLTSNQCRVYAVANVDENLLVSNSVEGLKATVIGSDFANTVVQNSFAMDGEAVLNLDRATRTVTGTINLQRAASKLTLSVELPESVTAKETVVNPTDGTSTERDVVYTPRADYMHVWLSNGVMESKLNTTPAPAAGEDLFSNAIRAVEGTGSKLVFDDSQPKYKFVQDIPFYSYPGKWEPYAASGNCRLTLVIPWSYTDAAGATQNIVTYYSMSVNPDGNELERNWHYDMRVSVNRLGGTTVQTPVDMKFDWNYVIEWNRQTLPTDLKEIRYLLLNNNDWNSTLTFESENAAGTTVTETGAYSFEMTNSDYIEIPFSSSHPVEVASVQLKWRDYYNNQDRSIFLDPAGTTGNYKYSTTVGGYNQNSQYAGIEIDQVNQVLKVKRSILHIAWQNSRPSIQDDTAISAYTFNIKLRHADDASTDANVSITQLPPIYITAQYTAEKNYRWINNNNTNYSTNNRKGYVIWAQYTTYPPDDETQSKYYLGTIHNSNTWVKNRNTYILNISKFATTEDKVYIIGDPRTHGVNNLQITNASATSAATWSMNDVKGKQLLNYYPADDNVDKKRFIAPQLRIASQLGVTYDVTRDGALRRCASYQENGRYAGRWRLPTIAEIEYIATLSSNQFIPYLFGSSGQTADYWCASGAVDVNNFNEPSVTENTSNDTHAVRCVYDEWYWGTDTLLTAQKGEFTWGDRLRSVNGNN